jgi:hypothetical protein
MKRLTRRRMLEIAFRLTVVATLTAIGALVWLYFRRPGGPPL